MLRPTVTLLCAIAASALVAAESTTAPPPATQNPPQNPQQQQPPTFRARVDSVSVDVSVTDKQGKPVTDLKAEDFEIREAGKVQTIDSFKLIETDWIAEEERGPVRPVLSHAEMKRETADPRNRVFLIFLDDYHTRRGNSLHIRQVLAQFVKGLSPRDLVALLGPLTPITAATFSFDHDGTALAISNFEGRKYNYAVKHPYEQNFFNLPIEVQEMIRNDLVIRNLQSACALLSSLRDGRKTLLFVSEGLAANIPQGAQTMGGPTQFGRPLTPLQASQRQVSQEFFKTADLMGRQRDLFTVCSRGNVAIYPLDPRGLAPSEFGSADRVDIDADRRVLNEAMDSLRTLADQTDGHAILGSNNPLPELKRMVNELGSYYLLAYTSTVAPRDGRFHEIQVKVKRKDVDQDRVRARKGYWAYSEEEIRKASAPPKPGPPAEVALAIDDLAAIVEPTSRRGVALWLGAVRTEQERPQVTLVWEATASGAQEGPDKVDRISVTATTNTGDVVFKGAVPRDPSGVRPSGRVTFAAPAGPIRLRIVTENARGQTLDTEDLNELIPDFTSPGATITAPLLFRGRTPYDIAQIRRSKDPMPVAGRQFSRTERLLMRFEAYGPAGTTPQVTLRLLNQRGEPVASLPAPTANGFTFEVEIGLGSLIPSDYLIEVAAVNAAGERTVKLLGIRITG